MKAAGTLPKAYGIRLDSGDLAYLSKEAHKMFADAGFPDAIIAASNDLDENLISELKAQGCAINSWGVGTNLITAKDSPSLGGVFKLVGQYDDGKFVPKIKMSDNAEKISNPGLKNVLRIYDKDTGKMKADIIILEGESIDESKDLLLQSDKAPCARGRFLAGLTVSRRCSSPFSRKANWSIRNRTSKPSWPMQTSRSRLCGPNTCAWSTRKKCGSSAAASCRLCAIKS